MSKELQELTDGQYTLAETEIENQFSFFRNDKEVLKNVGTNNVMVLFAEYLIENSPKGDIRQSVYEYNMRFEISADGKTIKLTVKNKPNLQIVKSEEKKAPRVAKARPNFFKRMTKKWLGKG